MTRTISIALAFALSLASAGDAAADPRDEFRRGLALYQAGDYTAAAAAFELAYGDKPSSRILFAWAQAVRQGGDCRKAVVLYDQLLRGKLRRKQRSAVKTARTECQRALAEAAAEPTPPIKPATEATENAPVAPAEPAAADTAPPAAVESAAPTAQDRRERAWYADPVGGVLLGASVVGLGVGTGFWIGASSSDTAAGDADNYFEFAGHKDTATTRRRIAAFSAGAGGALLVAAIVRYAIAGDGEESAPAAPAAWIGRDGEVGLAVGGAF